MKETQEIFNTLKTISKVLGNLKYDCCGREYTLDEDQMGSIFFCRDLADLIIINELQKGKK